MTQKKNRQSPDPSAEPGPGDKAVAELESADGKDAEAPQDVQHQVQEHEATQATKFGTFPGVFTPTLLTILGVIMFLRAGWVVGNAGLGGAFVISILSFAIAAVQGPMDNPIVLVG